MAETLYPTQSLPYPVFRGKDNTAFHSLHQSALAGDAELGAEGPLVKGDRFQFHYDRNLPWQRQ